MSELVWTIKALLAAMPGRTVGNMPAGIGGISIDTRTLKPGDAYFAIKGDIHDGHKFLPQAAAAGAALAVVSEEKSAEMGEAPLPLLVVEDVLKALGNLGVASRARSSAKIIAVTGSVGKTTTKEALKHVLEASGKVHASVASYNNHWGVPLTLARMAPDVDFGIFEIGMNHPGEITPLVAMVKPHVAIITTIDAAHLGAFRDLGEIADAKAEIFSGLVEDGAAILNRDNDYFDHLKEAAEKAGVGRIVGFGEDALADVRLEKVKLHEKCTCMTASILGQETVIKIGSPGRHVAQNALAVLAAAELAGADTARSVLALADLQSVKGRGQRHEIAKDGGTLTLIDESYNANPASMRAALGLLATSHPGPRGRRIAVLGDMLELGNTSKDLHRDLVEPILEAGVDQVYLAGPDMAALAEALPKDLETSYGENVDVLLPVLTSRLRANDVVMVKASLGIGFGRIVEQMLR